jgi:hypothetical protein
MLTILRNLLVLFALAVTASAVTEENISRQFDVTPGGKLIVDIEFGSIQVTPGENDKVVVDAYRKIEAASKDKEEEYFAAAPITITAEGDSVIVRAIRKKESPGSEFWELMGRTHTEGRYTIRVPATFGADLDTAGGNVSVQGLTGSIKADTSGGHIKATACDGTLELDTSGGHIEVNDGRGKVRANTSGGAVTVLNFAGDAKVESSGGKLRLSNISGKLTGETSGGSIAATLPTTVIDDISLETSAGSINVVTPANAALTIDAETSAGRVHSDLPITQLHADRNSLKGTINGGGKALTLRSGAGSIEIVSAEKQATQQ